DAIKVVNNSFVQVTPDINVYAWPCQDMANGVILTVSVAPQIESSSPSVRYFIRASNNSGTGIAQSPELMITGVKSKDKEKEKDSKESKDTDKNRLKDNKDFRDGSAKDFSVEFPLQATAHGASMASEDRLARLEGAMGQLMHFIGPH